MKNRQNLLKTFTKNKTVLEELTNYTKNQFTLNEIDFTALSAIPNDPQIPVWENYLTISQEIGVYQMLKKYLIPFQFPIQKGISQSAAYKAASLRGQSTKLMKEAIGLELHRPEILELNLYQSVAGKIPVLIVPNQNDFQTVIQALAFKNEPKPIPQSMGASIIKGLNNWERINRLKENWQSQSQTNSWQTYFKQSILPNKSLFQDKLIVLSRKPYSGVSATVLGLTEEKWLEYSLNIRLEHECAHYFTLRYLGGMYTNMHDELIADYMGITKTRGYFDSNWFLSFIGLSGESYRKGGRLENYLGTPRLSDIAVEVLQLIMISASEHVADFNRSIGSFNSIEDRVAQLVTLSSLRLDEIAAPDGNKKLLERYQSVVEQLYSSTKCQ